MAATALPVSDSSAFFFFSAAVLEADWLSSLFLACAAPPVALSSSALTPSAAALTTLPGMMMGIMACRSSHYRYWLSNAWLGLCIICIIL